jgi:RNA polymerase sigma-70 factor (ECF subfamily)
VQETFVRAIGSKIRHHTGTVSGFLGTIAYRLALKEAKRTKRTTGLDGLALADSGAAPLEAILKDERDRLVTEAIGSMDRKRRDVLIMRFYGRYSYEEIAEHLQLPLGTVKSRMFNAVKYCREFLRKKGVLK